MDKETHGNLKVTIFLIIVWIQGFINNLLQLTVSRYAFCFEKSEISVFSTGQALGGVATALLSFILSFINISISIQYVIFLGFTTI